MCKSVCANYPYFLAAKRKIRSLQATSKGWVANLGDCAAVVCRGGKALSVSSSHKPDRPDEKQRIVDAGGWITEEKVRGPRAVVVRALPMVSSPANHSVVAVALGNVDGLRAWAAAFPLEQLLLVRAEDMFDDAPAVLAVVQDFLGLERRLRPADLDDA